MFPTRSLRAPTPPVTTLKAGMKFGYHFRTPHALVIAALFAERLLAVELPPGFVAETIATNLNAATAIAAARDGRIFIADQTGRLLVWKNGVVSGEPALILQVTDYWERG